VEMMRARLHVENGEMAVGEGERGEKDGEKAHVLCGRTGWKDERRKHGAR